MPAVVGVRNMMRRQPTFVQPVSGSRAKSIDAEMYGAPSKACCKCTGSEVRSASAPTCTTSCTGASSERTSTGA